MIPVVTDLPAFRAAIAELPASARSAVRARDAVVVVDGGRPWVQAAADAAAAGARAVIVSDPGPASAADAELAAHLGLAVVVSRAYLRPDCAADAVNGRGGASVHAVNVDTAGGKDAMSYLLRDAMGWARELCGTPLELRAARRTGRGATVLLDAGGTTVSVGFGQLADRAATGRLRITALGEIGTDVIVDPACGRPIVVTATAAGRLEAPTRYESAERQALRRTFAALDDEQVPVDLADLAHDAALVDRVLTSA